MNQIVRHGEVMKTEWICPDCGARYYGAVLVFRFCPNCKAKKDRLEKEYWDRKRAGMRSVTSDIVARILAGAK